MLFKNTSIRIMSICASGRGFTVLLLYFDYRVNQTLRGVKGCVAACGPHINWPTLNCTLQCVSEKSIHL